MVPFSDSLFIHSTMPLNLISKVRTALQDTGGMESDIRAVLQDL